MAAMLNLEEVTLKNIVESPEFRARFAEIRDRTFQDFGKERDYRRVREYGLTVEADESGIYISDVIQGDTGETNLEEHLIFQGVKGIVLASCHTHKIAGGNYDLPPSPDDFEIWNLHEVYNKGVQNGVWKGDEMLMAPNPNLWVYETSPVGIVPFFYGPEKAGMQVYRLRDANIDSYLLSLLLMMDEKNLSESDMRRERGVRSVQGFSNRQPGITAAFYKSPVSGLYMPEGVSGSLPLKRADDLFELFRKL
ncbi:hypothetical protein HYY72_01545 [Candidatus Woesearchaeota archaeon]|nr:hypothetical protein [Candidatus Woesearchaeota archaeon]